MTAESSESALNDRPVRRSILNAFKESRSNRSLYLVLAQLEYVLCLYINSKLQREEACDKTTEDEALQLKQKAIRVVDRVDRNGQSWSQ